MVSISSASIALSVAVMLIAIAVVTGFKSEIRGKITGFGADIQVVAANFHASYETAPIDRAQPWLEGLQSNADIVRTVPFSLCPGVIKADDAIQGIVLKGITADYDLSFFSGMLTEGTLPVFPDSAASSQILLSRTIADALRLHTGDDVAMYFIQDPPRMRRLKLAGIFDTGIDEFDRMYAFADIRHVQRLNGWNSEQVSGYEISIADFKHLDRVAYNIFDQISRNPASGGHLRVETVRERYAHIFDWLALLDMNVLIILVLMILVAGFNMISGLLILILERTVMIGLFKAMGADNRYLRRIFMYQAGFIMAKGLLIGNIIALAVCLIQKHFELIRLDKASYFIDHVPIALHFWPWLLVNAASMACIWLMLQLPALVMARIEPAKTIRFN
ncbi:MAG: ABC transporter permease [Bacteroidales bacterium]|nr:ABC transporter permease [Bacteroidales bacterium]